MARMQSQAGNRRLVQEGMHQQPREGMRQQLREGMRQQRRVGMRQQLREGMHQQRRAGMHQQRREGMRQQLRAGLRQQLREGMHQQRRAADSTVRKNLPQKCPTFLKAMCGHQVRSWQPRAYPWCRSSCWQGDLHTICKGCRRCAGGGKRTQVALLHPRGP
jgi:hypothetical protein